MIKFFRHIRKSLLLENKTGKYFKYAIGEIVLVVIGILIAISINNWNTSKSDRFSEADYLNRLTKDLVRDTINYSWTSKWAITKQEAIENLLSYLETDNHKDLDSIKLLNNIAKSKRLTFAHPKVTTGTFDELKNTGSFKLIESTLLRSAITNYYFEREHHYDRIEKKRNKPSFGDEIDMLIPDLKRIDNVISYRTDLVSSKEILEYINKPGFKKILTSEFNLAIFIQEIQKDGLDASKQLLKQLKDEISK